jgi:hypothetical protein
VINNTRPSLQDMPGSGGIDWLEICALGGRSVVLVGPLLLRHSIEPFELEAVHGRLVKRDRREGWIAPDAISATLDAKLSDGAS